MAFSPCSMEEEETQRRIKYERKCCFAISSADLKQTVRCVKKLGDVNHQWTMEQGDKFSFQQCAALHLAIYYRQRDIVLALLEMGADPLVAAESVCEFREVAVVRNNTSVQTAVAGGLTCLRLAEMMKFYNEVDWGSSLCMTYGPVCRISTKRSKMCARVHVGGGSVGCHFEKNSHKHKLSFFSNSSNVVLRNDKEIQTLEIQPCNRLGVVTENPDDVFEVHFEAGGTEVPAVFSVYRREDGLLFRVLDTEILCDPDLASS